MGGSLKRPRKGRPGGALAAAQRGLDLGGWIAPAMRKTPVTAATLAMSASLAGLAYAAAPDGRSTEDSSVVSTFLPSH